MTRRRFGAWLTIGLVALLIFAVIWALGNGRYGVSPIDVVRALLSPVFPTWAPADPQALSVVLTLRLPRVAAAVLVGAALALSGACYQGVFNNPLVSPDLLGVSSGASLGAAAALLLGWGSFGVQGLAFVGGIVAVWLATSIPKLLRTTSVMALVLSGIIVSGLLSSILGLAKYVADPDTQLPAITYWQLGSLTKVGRADPVLIGIPIVVASVVLILLRWRLNVLSLGDVEASTLGIRVSRLRGLVIVCATLLTACAVCLSGTVGWVGLVIPHLGRLIVGPDNRRLLPAAWLLGGVFLLVVDTLARNLSSGELPLGVLTGIIGAPVYFILLYRQRIRIQ